MINNKAMELIGKAFYGNYKVGDIVLANVTDDNEDKKIVIKAPIVDTYGEQYVLDYNLESYYVDEEDIISIAPNENNTRFYPDDKLLFKSKDGQEYIVNFRGYTNFSAMDKGMVVMPNGMQMQVDISQLSIIDTTNKGKTYDWDFLFSGGINKGKKLSEQEIDTIDVYDDNIYSLLFVNGSVFDAKTSETIGLLSITNNVVKLAVILGNDTLSDQKAKRRLQKLANESNRVIVENNSDRKSDRRLFPFFLVSKENAYKYNIAKQFEGKLETPRKVATDETLKNSVLLSISNGSFLEQIKNGRDVNQIIDIIEKYGLSVPQEILIQKSKDMSNENIEITDKDVEIIESEPISEAAVNKNWLTMDNWYEQHPDKILGQAYEASGQYGKVTKYRGDINVLDLIDVDLNFIGADKVLNNPLASVSHDFNASAEIQKPEVEKLIEEVIEKAEKEIRTRRNNKKQALNSTNSGFSVVQEKQVVNTFKDTFYALNSNYYTVDSPLLAENKKIVRGELNISLEEVEVYTWYKTQIGQPLSKNYVALFKSDLFSSNENLQETYSYNVQQSVVNDWVKRGLLFKFKNSLLPKFEYQSGNIYDKKLQLENDKESIIELYGEDVFNNQQKVFTEAYNIVYGKRLLIGGVRGLKILPISRFAKIFMIKGIEDNPEEKGWKIKKVSAASSKNYGEPNLEADLNIYSDSKRDKFEEISLTFAFGWWILNKKPTLNESISHLDIWRYYIEGKNIPDLTIKPKEKDLEAFTKEEKEEILKKLKNDGTAAKQTLKSAAQTEGEKLFDLFLETQLSNNDKIRLETQYNIDYNNYLPIDLNKVPVAFTMAKYIKGKEEIVRAEKRDAVAFTMSNGSSILSYDVGVGKTPSAIFTISAFMDAGYCKFPCVVVPNQVYRQFIGEIKQFTPHIPIVEAYNLSAEYIGNLTNSEGKFIKPSVPSICVMTYDGFANIGFGEDVMAELEEDLITILSQGIQKPKEKEVLKTKIQKLLGKASKKTKYPIEDFGFDFMCYDEAHKMKKVFTKIAGVEKNAEGENVEVKNPYQISSGTESTVALRGFMVNHYIYKRNGNKNVLLLTATPFTNSPLEIFSMLSMVAYSELTKMNLNSIKTFFDTFIKQTRQLVILSSLKPAFKDVIVGFNNILSLQSLIRRFILYKTGEDVNIQRPKKYVLPYLKDIQNDISVELSEESKVETFISMTYQQNDMMDGIIDYVENGTSLQQGSDDEDDENEENVIEYEEGDLVKYFTDVVLKDGKLKQAKGIISKLIEVPNSDITYEISKVDADGFPILDKKGNNSVIGIFSADKIVVDVEEEEEELDEDSLSSEQKMGVRTIKGLTYSRNLALSPHLYKYSGLPKPTWKSYVEESPKLTYVMEAIRSVRKYHIDKNEPISGQVIYMDRGIQYFSLLKQYLVYEIGYKQEEVGIIKSGLKKDGVGSKDYIKNLFNGEIYNEKTKKFEEVSDDKRIKVVIGSSTIKEGMNLQKYGTVLYNCFIDWNPTDVQQLEGRIYRQGNTFNAVRIVNPLVIDSSDIFIFQKLQEKTARLNTIWSKDNSSNSLNTEDFNAEELKFALIRDPKVIAELRLIEQDKNLQGEKSKLTRLREVSQKLSIACQNILNSYDTVKSNLRGYRKFEETGDKWVDAQKLGNLELDAKRKPNIDDEGKLILGYYEKQDLRRKNTYKPTDEDNWSNKKTSIFYPTYRSSDFTIGVRDLKKYINDFINQYEIKFSLSNYQDDLFEFNERLKEDIEKIELRKTEIKSEENIQRLIDEAIQEKEDKKIAYKSINQLISQFGTLNYLLSDKKVEEPKVVDTEVVVIDNVEPILEEVKQEPITKAYAQKLIDTFSKTLRFLSGDEKEFIEKKISTLKKTIRFLND